MHAAAAAGHVRRSPAAASAAPALGGSLEGSRDQKQDRKRAHHAPEGAGHFVTFRRKKPYARAGAANIRTYP
jgi:hypothetical protein